MNCRDNTFFYDLNIKKFGTENNVSTDTVCEKREKVKELLYTIETIENIKWQRNNPQQIWYCNGFGKGIFYSKRQNKHTTKN